MTIQPALKKSAALILLGALSFLFAVSCTNSKTALKKPKLPGEDEVSSIPWNRPTGWEGSKGFGFMPQSR